MITKKLGIIGGNGFVGKAMQKLFPEALVFGRDAKQSEIDSCDAVFICVPSTVGSVVADPLLFSIPTGLTFKILPLASIYEYAPLGWYMTISGVLSLDDTPIQTPFL